MKWAEREPQYLCVRNRVQRLRLVAVNVAHTCLALAQSHSHPALHKERFSGQQHVRVDYVGLSSSPEDLGWGWRIGTVLQGLLEWDGSCPGALELVGTS